jgi:multisubunit Na+/H+ antiporter MnhC subunit
MLKTTFAALADPLSHWPAIVASVAFTAFVLMCYVTFLTLQEERRDEQESAA